MDRRLVALLVAGCLVGLAGCGLLSGGDSGTTPTQPTPTASQPGDVPEADPGASEGEGPASSYPPGYTATGVGDADTAGATHVDALVASSSYIFSYDALIQEDDANTAFSYQVLVDHEATRAYVIQDSATGNAVAYFEDDQRYLRTERNDAVQYNSTAYPFTPSEFTGFQFIQSVLDGVEYGDAEVIEADEGTYYRYVSRDVTDPNVILRNDVDESRIDRFDVSIVVDESGIVRHAKYVVEADREISVTMGVSERGSTTLDRPDWYDDAATS